MQLFIMEMPVTRVQQVPGSQRNPEFVKQIVFTDDVIEFVRHVFMNEVFAKKDDKDPGHWERKKSLENKELQPLMREDYVNDLLSMLRLNLTRFMPLSKMEKHEVNNMILIIANNIDFWFMMNWKSAGISKEIYFSDILSDSLINLLEAIMKMPQDGSIQKVIGEIYNYNEGAGTSQPQNKPLFTMPSFFNRGEQKQ